MLIGSAWYPEHWPEARWKTDLKMMREANLNVVRVGEFAWSTMEPTEGRIELDWLERATDLAAEHGIKTVMCTPTPTPPAWLTSKYPEVLRVNQRGVRETHGQRVHFNPTHPTYLAHCRRIAEALAKRFGRHPHVLGWQLDNEIGAYSFDDVARKAFQDFCRQRYGTLDELNRRWTTAYWSQTYTAWEQIPVWNFGHNIALYGAWVAFMNDIWRKYLTNQIDVMKPHLDASQFITHNFTYEYDRQDPHMVGEPLDFASVDPYCFEGPFEPAAMGIYLATTRDVKNRFWVMETQPGFINYSKVPMALGPGETRRMMYHQLGHGAEAILFWQWRSARAGQEQLHGTLVGQDGEPRPVLAEIAQAAGEFQRVPHLPETRVVPDVGLAWHFEDRHAVAGTHFPRDYVPWKRWGQYYGVLRSLGLDVAAARADKLFDKKVIFAASMMIIPPQLQKRLLDYVEAGGHLVLGPRCGFYDEDFALLEEKRPGTLLASALGAFSWEFYALPKPVKVQGDLGNGEATLWGELIKVTGDATTLLRFGEGDGWLKGQPAVVTRQIGKGRLTYVATWLDDALLKKVSQWACDTAGVRLRWPSLPAGIEVSRRIGQGRTYHILCNHSSGDVTLPMPFAAKVHVGRPLENGKLHLPPNDVAILEEQ